MIIFFTEVSLCLILLMPRFKVCRLRFKRSSVLCPVILSPRLVVVVVRLCMIMSSVFRVILTTKRLPLIGADVCLPIRSVRSQRMKKTDNIISGVFEGWLYRPPSNIEPSNLWEVFQFILKRLSNEVM